jgi:hypothetical protein
LLVDLVHPKIQALTAQAQDLGDPSRTLTLLYQQQGCDLDSHIGPRDSPSEGQEMLSACVGMGEREGWFSHGEKVAWRVHNVNIFIAFVLI